MRGCRKEDWHEPSSACTFYIYHVNFLHSPLRSLSSIKAWHFFQMPWKCRLLRLTLGHKTCDRSVNRYFNQNFKLWYIFKINIMCHVLLSKILVLNMQFVTIIYNQPNCVIFLSYFLIKRISWFCKLCNIIIIPLM